MLGMSRGVAGRRGDPSAPLICVPQLPGMEMLQGPAPSVLTESHPPTYTVLRGSPAPWQLRCLWGSITLGTQGAHEQPTTVAPTTLMEAATSCVAQHRSGPLGQLQRGPWVLGETPWHRSFS